MSAFIETQFPIARLSAESFKERKAGASQTLTGLGKWWGRKPLILVRALILGMLMPASNDPKKDREVFLKILTMDDDGVWERNKGRIKSRSKFDSLPYALRIKECERPESIDGPTNLAWVDINAHLSTNATSLKELIKQLGERTFGHVPVVGDSFCGGGSIPFEAARIGCQAFGSDLNPVATMLTWAGLNLLGASTQIQQEVREAQAEVLTEVDKLIAEWKIEHNDNNERTDAFLYCVEVKPEGCEYFIPVAPSWIVAEKYRLVAKWERVPNSDRLQPKIVTVAEDEFELFKKGKGRTLIDSRVVDPFDQNQTWSVEALRGQNGLRRWSKQDISPRADDVFQERIYCIRWIDTNGVRRYAAPTEEDLSREDKILRMLRDRLSDWQLKGFIPSRAIPEGGDKTDEPIRTRGWTYWHHLFTPRQLLMHGVFLECAFKKQDKPLEFYAACLVGIAASADWSSKLCRWTPQLARSGGIGASVQTFYNQALNPLFTWANRPFEGFKNVVAFNANVKNSSNFASTVKSTDARDINVSCDLWITDPPYADAVNYHELADFFLAWYEKQLAKVFPEWTPDARAELAVRGDGEEFRHSMVEVYKNLVLHMPDNGMQLVMFTHQNPAVWADLGMILWAAGLKATAAWTISTETEAAGIKKGNYVQGTVCLVLRKRTINEPGFLDEVYPLVEDEVRRQIASMEALDEGSEPNFNDADYQLAAYAAALKVLTQYSSIDGRDVEHEVFAKREKGQVSDFQAVIERALGIACNVLIPKGLDAVWRDLSLVERYYLRALDIESRGERRNGMYEELARGFGVTDIKPLLKSDKANGARMYSPSGFAASNLAPVGSADETPTNLKRGRGSLGGTHPFATSPVRHLIFAVRETVVADNDPDLGRQYLRDTFGQAYWGVRERFVALLEWFAGLGNAADMPDWAADAVAARILAGRLRNDHA